MSPVRGPAAAYWCAGGSILGRLGAITAARARALMVFFATEAVANADLGDNAAAGFCLSLARDLAAASRAARRWRLAGRPLGARDVSSSSDR